jgi:hypothetical protein
MRILRNLKNAFLRVAGLPLFQHRACTRLRAALAAMSVQRCSRSRSQAAAVQMRNAASMSGSLLLLRTTWAILAELL